MAKPPRPLTVEESFDHLGLSRWATGTLSDEQHKTLQQMVDKEGQRTDLSQARYLFELSRLCQQRDRELMRLLSDRALVAAEDPTCWLEGERGGLSSQYWGYQAFLEGRSDLKNGTADEKRRFYEVAEKQAAIGADHSERLRQMQVGPSRYHQHAGYFYLAEKAATEGDTQQAAALLAQAESEGWSGGWDYLRRTYQIP